MDHSYILALCIAQCATKSLNIWFLTLCRITWGLQSVLASARQHNLHLFSSFCLSFWSIYTIEPGRIHGLCQIWSRTLSPENLLLRVSFIIISIPHLDPHLCFEIGLCHGLQLPGCVGRESSTLWSVVQHETLVIIMITMITMLAIYDTDCNSIRTRNSIESGDILNEVFHLRRLRVNKVGWCTEPGGKMLGFEVSQVTRFALLCPTLGRRTWGTRAGCPDHSRSLSALW